MRALTSFLFLLLLLLPLPALGQRRYARATEIGDEDSLQSKVLGEQRPYIVYTPPSYGDSTAGTRYPVLYLLDGDAHFQSVSGLVQILGTGVNGTYVIPEMIVVAIPNTNRTRDLTPTHAEQAYAGTLNPDLRASGGGPAFLRFVQTELIPHIDARYRTMPWRLLVGHSLGGITVIDALYTMPQAFNAYVAIDPSLWWDGQTLLRKARAYFGTAKLSGKALYVAQANTIDPADTTRNLHFESITRFNAVVQAYDRSGIRYAFHYYDRDDHGSVPIIAEYDALRFIFDGFKLPLPVALDEPHAVRRHFADVSTRLGATFQPPLRLLGMLGQVAASRDTAKAIEFGQMAIELYPQHPAAYEALGDVSAARHDTARARVYYEQALARNPDSRTLRRKIEALAGGRTPEHGPEAHIETIESAPRRKR